jgi:hypothetical protein
MLSASQIDHIAIWWINLVFDPTNFIVQHLVLA